MSDFSEELDRIEDILEFSEAYFVPSHLTKGLFGTAVALVAGGVVVGATAYAIHQFRQVSYEEVAAMLGGVTQEGLEGG